MLKFAHDDRYVNPSRVSPLILEARLLSGNSRYELTVLGQTALCVSLIFVTESYIYETPASLKLAFHAIKGTYHSQEFERFGGTMGMVTGQQVLGMQIWNDVVTFQTKMTGMFFMFLWRRLNISFPRCRVQLLYKQLQQSRRQASRRLFQYLQQPTEVDTWGARSDSSHSFVGFGIQSPQ